MEQEHRQIIQRNIVHLSQGVDLEKIYSKLIEDTVMDDEDVKRIQKDYIPGEQATEFFMWIQTRGPTAFYALHNALNSCGYEDEAKLLIPELAVPVVASASQRTEVAHSSGVVAAEVVSLKTATEPYSGATVHVPVYEMTSNPRGFALIINNANFSSSASSSGSIPTRSGSEKDVERLTKLMELLGFVPTVRDDVHSGEITEIFENFIKQFREKKVNCCFVCVMSHGTANEDIYMADGALLKIWNDILRPFNNANCEVLIDIPKIFVINACRGDEWNGGVDVTETDSHTPRRFRRKSGNYPEVKDIILCCSTCPGYVSNRHPDHGSWYMQTFIDVVTEHAHHMELIDMLQVIANKLEDKGREFGIGRHQIPSFHSYGWSSKLYFNPGLYRTEDRNSNVDT